ncbi:MFS transporter [Streptomyces lasalocidi]
MSTHAPARPTYAAVLRLPHARRAFASALTARLSYGTVSLSVLLSVTRVTGSYAVSGAVLSLFGATTVFLMPLRAPLIDRYGPRRALPPMAALYGALLCALAALTWRPGTPAAPIATVAGLAGACAPPLGPTMRAVWAELAPEPGMLARAYSLDGVAEELLYVSGPVLVGVLTGVAPPAVRDPAERGPGRSWYRRLRHGARAPGPAPRAERPVGRHGPRSADPGRRRPLGCRARPERCGSAGDGLRLAALL